MTTRHIRKLIPLLAILILIGGCSDTTGPGPGGSDDTNHIDPDAGTFVLKSVDATLADGRFVRLELVGSDLVLDDDGEHVELTVAIRNAGARSLPGPTTLWLHPIEPVSVFVANPDTSLPVGSIIPYDGFIYDDEYGSDRVLEPGETSDGRLWRFHTLDQGSFSFGIRVESGLDPSGAFIAGTCFWDPNRNGVRDVGEPPLIPGHIRVTAPDSSRAAVRVDDDGRYAYPLATAGLHRVQYIPDFETFAPITFSTPNPRHVLITTDADGALRGFDDAHFGAHNLFAPGPPPIQFTDLPPDSLHLVPWDFLEADLVDSRFLVFDVGYSGCQPEHRFSLWMSGGFMESFPVQANIVLVHHTDEGCAAAWRDQYKFNLTDLGARFHESYGPGVLLLNLIDFHGEVRQMEWQIGGNPR